MKKFVLALAATAAFAGQAFAADMARPYTKAPVPVVAPVSWTGCYLGAGGGGAYAVRRHNEYVTATNLPFSAVPDADAGAHGWFGTVQGGCDFQFGGNWVAGAFADYDFSDINGQYSLANFTAVGTWKQDYSWAVGARIGYLVLPQLLTYVSGGYTQAHFKSINFVGAAGLPLAASLPGQTRDGWFIGAGDEYALSMLPGLFWKTEYRYSRFDGASTPLTGVLAGIGDRTSRVEEHSVRSEIVYRFNWGR